MPDSETQAPSKVGDVILTEAGSQGQPIGRMTLAFGASPPERPIALDDGGQKEVKRRALIERKIKAYRMEIDAWSVDPSKAEAVKAKQAQISSLEAQLREPEPAPEAPVRPNVK